MGVPRGRSLGVRLAVGALALGTAPGLAAAHDVTGSRFDAPIPLSLLYLGAGATVALTALWLAATDRTAAPSRRVPLAAIPPTVARPVRGAFRAGFLAGVASALVLGLVGRQVAAENFATVFTWPVWIRGVALLALLVGSPWPTLSPWHAVHDLLSRLEGRPLAVLGTLPARVGVWPALGGFLLLVGVVEGLTVVPRTPRLTTVVVAAYALTMVAGSVLYGRSWLRRADPLGVFYRLFGRVAPVRFTRRDDGGYDLSLCPPWCGCLAPVSGASAAAFVVATVYTVSFDGFANTEHFRTALDLLRNVLGTGPATSVLFYLFGFAVFLVAFGLTCWSVERLGSGTAREWPAAVDRFAPTVLPIAAAYEVAHNYPYVLRNLGQLAVVALRPLASVGPFDPLGWLSLPAFWGSQVVLVVLGHVVAVVAAHDAAVGRYESLAAARWGHLPLVVLMVGYTVLSLWIVSQPVVAG